MNIPKLKKELLAYVASQNPNLNHEWQLTADKLGITKEELEYIVDDMGSSYFREHQLGFFAENRAIIEGKHNIEPQISTMAVTNVITEIKGDNHGIIAPQSTLSDNDFRPTLNPIEKPAAKDAASMPSKTQKIGIWIISNIGKFIFYVLVGIVSVYLLIKFGIQNK